MTPLRPPRPVELDRAELRELLANGNIMKAGADLDKVQDTFDQLYRQNNDLMEHNTIILKNQTHLSSMIGIVCFGGVGLGVCIGVMIGVFW